MTRELYTLQDHGKLVVVMVGLPARGKSYIARKLARYLNWLQYDTKIFNVGDRRRNLLTMDLKKSAQLHSAAFFDPDDVHAKALREQVAMESLDALLDHLLLNDGSVALFDATNSSRERRELILARVRQRAGPDLPVLFLESQCSDLGVLEANMSLKLRGPDYLGQDAATALLDFRERVKMYEKKYETLGEYEEDRDYSYCQMINVGRKVTLHNIHGFLANQTVQYLQHFHLRPRQIWLTRSAESYDDVDDRVGGESSLTDAGIEYAKVLHIFINEQRSHQSKSSVDQPMAKGITRCQVLTSNIPHSIETASFFNESSYLVMHVKFLDELNPGSLTGLTREQIKEQHVQWYRDRESNKIRHRYPGITGESYLDVRERLKSIILEVERMHEDVVLLSGLAVMRVLIAYFKGLEQEEMPELDVPLGTVYMFEPKPYGIVHQEYRWDASSKVFLEVKRMDNS